MPVNLRALDLNLLVVFDAIARERSVTRAADRVGLSQPAASNALTRLRGHLRDELFLRGPDGLRPTPRAAELAPRIRAILAELEQALEAPVFDPASSARVFTVAAVDYFSVVVAPPLLAILGAEAPGVRVVVTPSVGRSLEALDHGEIDFAAASFGDAPERFGRLALVEDDYAVMVRAGHPLAEGPVTLPRYAAQRHLLVSPRGDPRGFVDDALARSGLTRHVAMVINHFAAAPPIVAESDLVLTAPSLVLRRLAGPRLALRECPVPAPPAFRSLDLVWRDRLGRSPAHDWMRGALVRAAQAAAGAPPAVGA
jgi:DNA-binding transcriptional LysR family regulator